MPTLFTASVVPLDATDTPIMEKHVRLQSKSPALLLNFVTQQLSFLDGQAHNDVRVTFRKKEEA
jgi:hypothetical protein